MTVPIRSMANTKQEHLDDHNGQIRDAANRRRFVHNVLEYGARGSNVATTGTISGGMQDDTAGIQAALDAADLWAAENLKQTGDANGTGIVYLPGNRNYNITSTLNVPPGVKVIGGHGAGHGPARPLQVHWQGADGGTMMETVVTDVTLNIPGTHLENFCLIGRHSSTVAGAATGYKFRRVSDQTGGKLDTGTQFIDVWMSNLSGNGLEILVPGTTNFVWTRGRFDQIGGYAIYSKSTSNAYMVISDMTYDNWIAGEHGYSNGFLFLDGEAAGTGQSFVSLQNLHLEVNGSLRQTFLPTAYTPRAEDTRGVIRLGCNTSSSNVRQHNIFFNNLWIPSPSTAAAYSCFQVTSPNLAVDSRVRNAASVAINGLNYSGPGTILAGVPDGYAFPWSYQAGAGQPQSIATIDYHPEYVADMATTSGATDVYVPAATMRKSWQRGTAVPGERQVFTIQNRSVADAITTNASTTLTSANSGRFESTDVGAGITGTNIPASTTIAAVVDAKTITLSAAATGSGTITATITPPTTLTIAARHRGYVIESTSGSATSLVLPVLHTGFEVEVYQQGAGAVTFSPASGVTIRNTTAAMAQFSTRRLRYRTKTEVVIS